MSKNLHQTKNSNVTHVCAVPEGTKSGGVFKLGPLTAWALTDRATAETIANGTAAQCLKEGQATCELAGVSTVVLLPATAAGAAFTEFSVNGAVIGIALEDYEADSQAVVALVSF